MDKFTYQVDDKVIRISGPCEMAIQVDFDDVFHSKVENEVRRLVDLLNRQWRYTTKTYERCK